MSRRRISKESKCFCFAAFQCFEEHKEDNKLACFSQNMPNAFGIGFLVSWQFDLRGLIP